MIFLNTSDLMTPEWRFLEPFSKNESIRWEFYSGVPRSGLERRISRPHIGRWRAAAAATTAAIRHRNEREGPVLVSHLPTMAAATNMMRRLRCPEVPQVAFAFNFTRLPRGLRQAWMGRALRDIDEFVVFSRFERVQYSRHFDIDEGSFRYLPWSMCPPQPGPDSPVGSGAGKYVCSIGGEGRDYRLLADVMRSLPHVRLVIVARPYSIAGISFPENVKVFTNLPGPQTWKIAVDSTGMVIPLRSAETACGHITLVGAQMLGIPLAITRSLGVEEYASEDTARLVSPGDIGELRSAVSEFADGGTAVLERAERSRQRAGRENSIATWLDYFNDLSRRISSDA